MKLASSDVFAEVRQRIDSTVLTYSDERDIARYRLFLPTASVGDPFDLHLERNSASGSAGTADPAAYAESVTPRVILVDGKELARLMIEYGVVATARKYEIKRIDID